MTRRKILLMTAGATAIGLAALVGFADYDAIFADDDDDEGQEALIKKLGDAKISLQQGLAASEQAGQPISANLRSKTASSSFRSTPRRMANPSKRWSTM